MCRQDIIKRRFYVFIPLVFMISDNSDTVVGLKEVIGIPVNENNIFGDQTEFSGYCYEFVELCH